MHYFSIKSFGTWDGVFAGDEEDAAKNGIYNLEYFAKQHFKCAFKDKNEQHLIEVTGSYDPGGEHQQCGGQETGFFTVTIDGEFKESIGAGQECEAGITREEIDVFLWNSAPSFLDHCVEYADENSSVHEIIGPVPKQRRRRNEGFIQRKESCKRITPLQGAIEKEMVKKLVYKKDGASQFKLGEIAKGKYGEPNWLSAYSWFSLAEKSGFEPQKSGMEAYEAGTHLTAEQRSIMDKRIEGYLKSTPLSAPRPQ